MTRRTITSLFMWARNSWRSLTAVISRTVSPKRYINAGVTEFIPNSLHSSVRTWRMGGRTLIIALLVVSTGS